MSEAIEAERNVAATPDRQTPRRDEARMPAATKFCDLVAYLQLLQNRITLTLGVVGLTVTATGAMDRRWPFSAVPDGTIQPSFYAAALALTLSAISAAKVISVPAVLRQRIFERLRSRELPSADYACPALQDVFVSELERKQTGLRYATTYLFLSIALLSMHFYLTTVTVVGFLFEGNIVSYLEKIGFKFAISAKEWIAEMMFFVSQLFSIKMEAVFLSGFDSLLTIVILVNFVRMHRGLERIEA